MRYKSICPLSATLRTTMHTPHNGKRKHAKRKRSDAPPQCTFVSKAAGEALLTERLSTLGITTVSSDLAAVSTRVPPSSAAFPLSRPPSPSPARACAVCMRSGSLLASPCLRHAFHRECVVARLRQPLLGGGGAAASVACPACFDEAVAMGEWV